jgi:hypothetical protein
VTGRRLFYLLAAEIRLQNYRSRRKARAGTGAEGDETRDEKKT